MPLEFRDRRALDDLVRYASDAVSHAAGLTLDGFISDRKSQQAAMYAIATVAESAGKLSPACGGRAAVGSQYPDLVSPRSLLCPTK